MSNTEVVEEKRNRGGVSWQVVARVLPRVMPVIKDHSIFPTGSLVKWMNVKGSDLVLIPCDFLLGQVEAARTDPNVLESAALAASSDPGGVTEQQTLVDLTGVEVAASATDSWPSILHWTQWPLFSP